MVDGGRVTVEEGVIFGKGGGRWLRCDIYLPPGRPERAPAVLLLHGGAWRSGDRSQLRGYGILLSREGYVCVCSEYRLSGEAPWPAQIEDVKAAIRWMRANADRLGIDPERIAVSGNSAGAHLALVAAGTAGTSRFEGEGGNPGVDTRVAAALAIYAPVDLTHAVVGRDPDGTNAVRELMGPAAREEEYRHASPLTYATTGFPPTLLIHGNEDEVVSHQHSIRMYEALEHAGVPVELHIYAGQPHAFDATPEFGRQCASVMRLFLDRYVRREAAVAR